MDDVCPVTFEPPEVVLSALKALVGYVGPGSGRAHADEPLIRSGSHSEEGFCHLLVGGGSSSEAEARYDPARVDGTQQAKAYRYHPRLLDHPMSACPAIHPCPRRLQSRVGIAELSRAS